MHELSIMMSVVDSVNEATAGKPGRIAAVRLRIGALAGVVEDSLRFGYELATEGTPLKGAALEIENLPVVIFCAQCNAERTMDGVQSFRCPVCGTASGDIRQGRELEIASIVMETEEE